MNTLQFLLFFVYVLSVGCAGISIYTFLNKDVTKRLNKVLYLGECFLLGNILFVGILLVISLLGLFKVEFLWSAVAANFLFLLHPQVRKEIYWLFKALPSLTIPGFLFIGILSVFFFRNCYFLFDVDSLSTYLYAQKLWLAAGTSLIGDPTFDIRLFNPQYDAIAYSLGLSIFGQETLFPELVTVFWRIICLLLIFGYATYRFNGYYGLAATLFVVLNDHFFYTGVNHNVILNAAVIGFLFAATYNFWEAMSQGNVFRFALSLIFLSQIPACKLYALYAVVLLLILGVCIQKDSFKIIKEMIKIKKYVWVVVLASILALLWYVKNFLITGSIFFPFLSGTMQIWGWTVDQQNMMMKINQGLDWSKIIKYFSFLFIWPGVTAAKYVLMGLVTFPIIVLSLLHRKEGNKTPEMQEVCYWLGASTLILFGLCLALWQDPRLYRFPLCIYAFTVILYGRFILLHVFNIKKDFVIAGLLIILSLQGYHIIKDNGFGQQNPTVKDNVNVILNRLHMADVVKKHYPEVLMMRDALEKNSEKVSQSAWFVGENSQGFLLPHRPRISVFFSTTIPWDAYASEAAVTARLKSQGLQWVMVYEPAHASLDFVPVEEFSRRAMKFERYPSVTYYDYGFPSELTKIN